MSSDGEGRRADSRDAARDRTTFGIPTPVSQTTARLASLAGDVTRIGRDRGNDIVLDDPNVSRFHAEVRRTVDGLVLRDVGSRNGTRLDGEFVQKAPLPPGATVGIGSFALVLDGEAVVARDEHRALALAAEDVGVVVAGDTTILHPTSLAVLAGEFLCVIGGSGYGKSSLLAVLAGERAPTTGRVTVGGDAVATRRAEIGYVPQDEVVHRDLDLREALTYAARLRLPNDASTAEIGAAVERVADELGLTEQLDVRVGLLSGGERKRVAVAAELVNRPGILFLDEPTSGLDPQLERRTMALLRQLADNGRAVVAITHATASLDRCDKLAVLSRGGRLAFVGSPEEALEHFGVERFEEIYAAADEMPPAVATVDGDATRASSTARPTGRRARAGGGTWSQLRVLVARYAKLLWRDRRNVAILAGQVPVLGVAIALVFHSGVLDRPSFDLRDPDVLPRLTSGELVAGPMLLFMLVTVAFWVGATASMREIVRERRVLDRETAIGVRVRAYLMSKLVVLFAITALQTLGVFAIVVALRPLDVGVESYAIVAALLVLTSWVGVAMGLCISALATRESQATSAVPLILIPQLLLGGAVQPVAQLGDVMEAVSVVVFARWAFAGVGTEVDIEDRLDYLGELYLYGDFFRLAAAKAAGILGIFLVVFLAVTAWSLRRRSSV